MAGGGGGGGSSTATQYSWGGSAISKMIVASNISGQAEATIHASPDLKPGALSQLTNELSRKGMGVYFDEVNGEQVLKVQDFSNTNILVNTLMNTGAAQGNPAKEDVNIDGVEKSTWTKVREKGTNIAGALGMVGHAGLMLSGAMAGDMDRVKAGALYGTSAGILATYGVGNKKLTSELCNGLYDNLRSQGVEFTTTEHATPTSVYRNRKGFEKGYDGFKKHSLAIANGFGVFGNIDMAKSGMSAMKREGFEVGVGRFGHGAVNLVGAGVASFVPETSDEKIAQKAALEASDPNKKADAGGLMSSVSGGLAAARDGIAKGPLAFQGGIMLTDNILDMKDALEIKKSYERRDSKEIIDLPPKPDDKLKKSNPKKFKEQNSAYKKAMKGISHYQRLDMNYKSIEELVGATDATELLGELHIKDKPMMSQAKKIIGAMNAEAGVKKELETLFSDRQNWVQELVEKERFGKNGWIVAAAKVGAWTASSTFQMLAKKNIAQSVDTKYGEIFANVATMALEVPAEQRAEMIEKSAGYLAAQEAVYISTEEISVGIANKLAALEQSPWHNVSQEPVLHANAEPNTHIAEASLSDTLAAAPHVGARLN